MRREVTPLSASKTGQYGTTESSLAACSALLRAVLVVRDHGREMDKTAERSHFAIGRSGRISDLARAQTGQEQRMSAKPVATAVY